MRTVLLLCVAAALVACDYAPPGQCVNDSGCPSGLSCKSGVCVGCAGDGDCASYQSCSAAHVCQNAPGRCSRVADCQNWELCDDTNHCVLAPGACATQADCHAWEDCSSHACTLQFNRCNAGADCLLGLDCDLTSNTCAPSESSSDVLLWGSLTDVAYGYLALCRPSLATSYSVGWAEFDSIGVLTARGFLYQDVQGNIRAYEPDPFDLPGNIPYARDPDKNDPILLAKPCANVDTLSWVPQEGTGAIAYTCGSNQWLSESGATVLAGETLLAWQANGNKLVIDQFANFTFEQTGSRRVVAPVSSRWAVHSHGSGFWLAAIGGESATRYDVQASGTDTQPYPSLPASPSGLSTSGIVEFHNSWRMDGLGVLYQTAHGSSSDAGYIVQRVVGAQSTIVYDGSQNPPDGKHARLKQLAGLVSGP
ncbi:MAG: hypothetical protein JST92_05790 [Deltaproteobacteria bacterium]|nr:hypothetical protein [Deltaproteobacteria bacterium]